MSQKVSLHNDIDDRKMKMYRNVFIVLVALLMLSACEKKQTADSNASGHAEAIRASTILDAVSTINDHKKIPAIPLNYSAERYFNASAHDFSPDAFKGKVVLLDLWDLSCINCIHTLPFIKKWNQKYKDSGLVIIGVHSPEFESEKSADRLRAAIEKFGITYPVIADNEFTIWKSLSNEYWPAAYLYDRSGALRKMHYGEGDYEEFELQIQKLLLERAD
ncbi:MAG: redoxin domain-containing protein [Ignavibacteriota bacterium]